MNVTNELRLGLMSMILEQLSRRALACTALCTSLLMSLSPARAGDAAVQLSCPDTGVRPVGQVYNSARVLMNSPMGLAAPFAPLGMLFDFLFSDDLAKLPKTKASLTVVDADGQPIRDALIAIIFASSRRFVAQLPADGREIVLPVGDYIINAITSGPSPRWGSTSVSLKGKDRHVVRIQIQHPFAQNKPAVLDKKNPAGATVKLDVYDGVFEHGAIELLRQGEWIRMTPFKGWPADVILPPTPGSYVLRIAACAPTLAVAEWSFEVAASNLRLRAPDELEAASEFEVTWTGDGSAGDLIGMRNPATGEFLGGDFEFKGVGEQKARLIAPFDAGRFDLVYRSSVGPTVLSSRPVQVLPSPLKISVPDSVVAGESYSFNWPTGPGNFSRLSIVSENDPDAKPLAWLKSPGANRIIAPPGTYRVQLVDGAIKRWGRKINVTPSRILDSVPAKVAAGSKLRFEVGDMMMLFDEIILVPAGARDVKANQLEVRRPFSGVIEFDVRLLPGQYELIYLASDHADDSTELARRRVEVGVAEGRPTPQLTAPDRAPLLEPVLVSWTNPDDFQLEIWCADCGRGASHLVRTLEHAAVTHLALLPGSYDLRLKAKTPEGTDGRLVARQPMTVAAQKILNEVPATVSPGSKFNFKVTGSPAFFDKVVITKAGSRKSPFDGYSGLSGDTDKGEIFAPDEPGAYELLYLGSYNDNSADVILDRVRFVVK